MREIKLKKFLGSTKIELYDSIKELPAERNNEYNKLAFLDIGVGSTLDDFNAHFGKLHAYLQNKKSDEALQEMSNVYKNFFYAINKVSIWSYCFCAFIKTIDGKEYDKTDISDHRETIIDLSKKGLTTEMCQSTIDEVKKNLIQNFSSTFLADIVTQEVLTYYQNLKDKL